MMKSAAQKIVVVDGSKFGRVTFAHVAPLTQIDILVTDSSAPKEDLDALTRMGLEVLLAD
jgi:DeoR family transcriptional regulator of aga operon